MNKLEKMVSAARKHLRSGNRIEAIKAVRAACPDAGLKGAKDFVDWLEMQTLSIRAAAACWCLEHWCAFNFHQAGGHFSVAHAGRNADAPSLTPASKAVNCKCGNPVCADLWHRLARWLEEDPGNGRKLQAWLKAMWEEHPDADHTFEAAPGLWLVWSGAKVELTEEIAESDSA
jgi:hypothetical protein